MISALYVRKDSVYKSIGVDCWDIERDARLFPGGNSVIAHPPCRAWGNLSHFAKPRPDEKDLAIHAVKVIRKCGGVLEHPAKSKLWREIPLPIPGNIDEYGGFSVCVDQSWWGHRAQKRTLLYIVGIKEKELPDLPISFDAITHTISTSKKTNRLPETSKKEREATPERFALWLIEVATLCNQKMNLNETKIRIRKIQRPGKK